MHKIIPDKSPNARLIWQKLILYRKAMQEKTMVKRGSVKIMVRASPSGRKAKHEKFK